MKNGYNIVIGGKGFKPEKFKSNILKPSAIINDPDNSFIEFNNYEDTEYSLDMVAEAIDTLEIYKSYFLTFMNDPNIEYKQVNFFIESDYENLDFTNKNIEILHELGFTILCSFTKPNLEKQNT